MPRNYQKKHPNKTNLGRPVKWTPEAAQELCDGLESWMREDGNVYFEEYLVLIRGLYPDIIGDLSSKYDFFFQSIKKARKLQELKLAKLLLNTRANPGGPIFALKNNGHNWTDKHESKTQNVNYNYDAKDLKAKTDEELQDLLINLTTKEKGQQS